MGVAVTFHPPLARQFRPTILHLFPGQGELALTSFLRAVQTHRVVRDTATEVFAEIDTVARDLGAPLVGAALLGRHPPRAAELDQFGAAQLVRFGASVTAHRALCASDLPPDRVVGVSFGEVAALVAAGAVDVADGARIAHAIARSFAHPAATDGGMLLLRTGATSCRALLAATPRLAVACVNDPAETVVSGPRAELAALEGAARRRGVTTVRIRLPFYSHHPCLAEVAAELASTLRDIPIRPPRLPVYSAVRGGAYPGQDDLHRALADCLVKPALLPPVLRLATAGEPCLAFEAGAGHSLSRSARSCLATERVQVHAPIAEPHFPWPDHDHPPPPPTVTAHAVPGVAS